MKERDREEKRLKDFSLYIHFGLQNIFHSIENHLGKGHVKVFFSYIFLRICSTFLWTVSCSKVCPHTRPLVPVKETFVFRRNYEEELATEAVQNSPESWKITPKPMMKAVFFSKTELVYIIIKLTRDVSDGSLFLNAPIQIPKWQKDRRKESVRYSARESSPELDKVADPGAAWRDQIFQIRKSTQPRGTRMLT